LTFDAPKTKAFTKLMQDLSIGKKALFVTADPDENVALSARNIQGMTVVAATGINVLDLLGHDKVVMTKAAIEKIEEVLS
jgi:large subunit ribosomal protein L4